MAEMTADAVGLMETAGWSACRVTGVSFGGLVAQGLAVTNPERVDRLVLACTSPGGEVGSSYPPETLLELPPEERITAALMVVDRRWDERWLDDHPADRALAERLAAGQMNPAPTSAHRAQLEAREGHDVWDRLSAITCPTLVG
jgi:3-oxoadipate enol-lactonase